MICSVISVFYSKYVDLLLRFFVQGKSSLDRFHLQIGYIRSVINCECEIKWMSVLLGDMPGGFFEKQ